MMRKPLFLWKRLFLQESCRAAAAPVHFPWLQRSEGSRGAAPFSSGAFGAEHGERWRRGLVPEPGGACRQPALPRTLRPCRGRVCTGRGIARDVPVCVPGQRPVSRVCERGACRTRYTKTVPACAPRAGNRKRGSILHTCRIGCAPRSGKVHEDPPYRSCAVRGLSVRREAALPVALPAAACWGKGCAPPYGGKSFPGVPGTRATAALRRAGEKASGRWRSWSGCPAATPCGGSGVLFQRKGRHRGRKSPAAFSTGGSFSAPLPPPLPSPPPWASIAVREAGAFRVFFPAFFCPALPVPQPGIIHVR